MASEANPKVKQARKRIARAETDRNRHAKRIDDCYRFALPWRRRTGQSTNNAAADLDDIFDSTAMTVVEDFAADMLNTFTPMKADWVEPKPVQTLDAGDTNILSGQLQKYASVIFSQMRRSNLFQALQESYLDLATGTMAILIQDRHPSEPLHCQAVPITDLLIERGPWGDVGARWRKWKVAKSDIKALWPEATPPNGQTWSSEDATEVEITDGLWRDWTDLGNEAWQYIVLIGNDAIYEKQYKGAGSCPLIVARWSRDGSTAWGVGPLYRSMPDVKTVNHVKYLGLKNLDRVVDPVTTYEDDGVINVDQGIEPGSWIPRMTGSKAPEVLESKGRFDVQYMEVDDLRSSIRRAHYQDRPEQSGKTPPTATQWADEAAERARRMGTPATNLVIEWQYPIFRRFAYLLTQRGMLPKVELNGKEIALEPVSPLLRAQEQEEVVRGDRFLELIGARFGQEAVNLIVKQADWATWLAEKMGVPAKLIRSEAEMKAAVENLAPLFNGGEAAPPGVPA